MDWLGRMNGAMSFIEEHLTEEISFEEVEKIACCSVYHFQRMFSFIADVPLSEYVRRRRLTFAAFELQDSDIKIIDLAIRYGYDSPISFTRAFKNQHGVTPSLARDKGVQLKAYPRISFHITIKGDVAMDYRIIKKDGFTVYGIEGIFTTENGENLKAIPKFWTETLQDGRYNKLAKSANIENSKGLCLVNAVCGYRTTGGNTFPYMLFVLMTDVSNADGYTAIDIPSATWAIFKSREHSIEETSDVFQDLSKRVYTEWLPTAS
ncbi:MAG: effector binding domain-containing protein, partial [Clostridiales bacterium]|nr:effector binding domain-containing protein [Clostridiales bacterium]